MNALVAILSLTAMVANGQSAPARKIRFNGRALTVEQLTRLEALERQARVRVPDAA